MLDKEDIISAHFEGDGNIVSQNNWYKLQGKVILDCHNICPLEGVYHI